MKKIRCYHCLNESEFEPPLSRSSVCTKCKSDSKVCLNCQFFDLNAYRNCRESQAEWVKEKDRANYCSYFEASIDGNYLRNEQQEAKDKLSKLFAKSENINNHSNTNEETDPKKKLADLFKK